MALTRITSTVVSANAISAEKIANNAITTRMIAAGAVSEDEIDSAITANTAGVEARRVANIAGAVSTITTGNLTASRALVSDGSGKVAASTVPSANLAFILTAESDVQAQINGLETRRTNNIAGGVSSILTSDLTASRALVSGSGGKVEVSAVTSAEVAHLDGVTSAIQTQLDAKQATITGAATTIDDADLTASRAVVSSGSGKVAVSAVTSTELGYLDGVTSAIQTQLDSKQATITGAATTIDDADLTADRAVISSGSGKVAVSAVTATELGYLDGVTSAVQTQLNAKQATITGAATSIDDADLTASRALASDSSGKVAVSAVTATELGHLDGVTSAIQTQLDAVEARRAANNITTTFTGQVNLSDDLVITGNLVVNGDTTTANSVNMVVQDRMMMLANSATGTPATDVGILFNRGNQGNAAFFYDESAVRFKLSDTKDPSSNTSLSPVTSSNLELGTLTATTITGATSISSAGFTQNGATLDNLISSNVDGAISSVNDTNLTASRALASDGSGKIAVSAVTSTELGYLDGVTSAIQTQLDAKQATITGAATTIDDADLTASRAVISSGAGKVAVSAVTSTELGYLDGVTSAIQTQLNAKQATITGAATSIDDADLTASRALVSDSSGKVAVSAVTATEIGHLDGVTSAIQTQLTGAETRRTNNIAGAVSTITTGNLTASRALASDGSGKVAVSAVTATELGHLDGVTSAVQTQLDTATTNTHSTFTRLNANLNTTSSNVTNLETRLNANLDIIQDNVAGLSGSVQLVPHHNVNTSTSTSNVFFIGKNVRSLNNVISLTVDGVSQTRDVPGTSNNDFIYHSSNNTVQMTDASLPAGLKVQMFTLFT